MTASLSLKQDGPVVEMTLAARSPDNLISPSFSRELQAACEQIGSDEACRAVLLTAEGDVFSRGWDWRAFAATSDGGSLLEAARACGVIEDPFGCLQALTHPVVCAIN